MKLGRDDEALAALQTAAQALARQPAGPDGAVRVLPRHRQLRRGAQARRAVGDAGTASPHENLARIALAEGDLDGRRAGGARGARAVSDAAHPAPDPGRASLHDRRRLSRGARRARPGGAPAERPRRPSAPEPAASCAATAWRAWAASAEAEAAFLRGDPRLSRRTPRRAPRSRCSTRARGARPTRARRSTDLVQRARARPRPTSRRAAPTRSWATRAAPRASGRGPTARCSRGARSETRGSGVEAGPRLAAGRRRAAAPTSRRSRPVISRRRVESLQSEHRRRDVGERRRRRRARPSVAADDERHRVGRVRRVRLAGRRDRSSARRCRGRRSSGAWRPPRGTRPRGCRSSRSRVSTAAIVSGSLPVWPTMSALAKLTTQRAEASRRAERADGLLRDLGRAHLRDGGRRSRPSRRGRGSRSSPGIRLLDAAVEEVGHVRVLLGLGQAQVRDARARPRRRRGCASSACGGKAAGRPNSVLYSVKPTKWSFGRLGPREVGELRLRSAPA